MTKCFGCERQFKTSKLKKVNESLYCEECFITEDEPWHCEECDAEMEHSDTCECCDRLLCRKCARWIEKDDCACCKQCRDRKSTVNRKKIT
jgi:hypothetical protein